MKPLLVVIVAALACSKSPTPESVPPTAPPTPAEAGTPPPSAAPEAGAAAAAEPVAEPAAANPANAGKPANPASPTETAPEAVPAPPPAPRPGLAPLAALPEVPEEILPLVARRAAMSCPEGAAPCPAVLSLAAKIEAEPAEAKTVVESGTDQEKAAMRRALAHVRAEACDELVIGALFDSSGALDATIAERVRFLRTNAAVKPLLQRLPKTAGEETIAILDTLGAIGTEDAKKALLAALDDKTLAPYWGEVCRNVARNAPMAPAVLTRIQEVGQSLAATERQAEGCRNAEAALRMLESAGSLIYNVAGRQEAHGKILVRQRRDAPHLLDVSLAASADATCEAPGELHTTFVVSLGRDGRPVVGAGIPAALGEGPSGQRSVYFLRFDTFEGDNAGGSVTGRLYATRNRDGDQPHLIVSGPFDGVLCGQ